MATLVSCPKHNMVACLEKTEQNAQFHEIVDFLTQSSIYYSLTISPTFSTSLIKQFWNTVTSKTVNDVSYIKAKVAGKTVSISETSIRRDLLFHDVDGIDCLTNQEIYENLQLMGSKSTSWDHFPTNIASALIFLATDRKFNFSKMIFEGHVTPLFPNMLAQAVVDKGEGSKQPTKPQPTPSPTQPSTRDQPLIPYDSPLLGGHTSDRAGASLNLDELLVLCTNLSNRVLALETSKDAQSVQRLSMKKRLGKKESVSKQGRKTAKSKPTLDAFDDLDADLAYGMDYMGTEEAVNEGRQSNETEELNLDVDTEVITKDKGSGEKEGSTISTARIEVNTARPEVDTARPDIDTAKLEVHTANALVNTIGVTITTVDPEVSAVEPRTPPIITSIFDDEDITMAQTLIKMKEEKAKEKGVAFKDVEDSSRLVRSITTLKPLPSINPKDKGKEKAPQEEAPRVAIMEMFNEIQAGIDADALFTTKLQQEEREEYTIKERAKFLAKTIVAQRKFRDAQRADEIRSRLPTKSQLRNLMMTYLKNIDDAVKDSKKAAGEDTSKKKEVLKEPDSTKIESINKEDAGERVLDVSKKRKGGPRMKRMSKRKKTESDLEEEEDLKTFLKIVLDKEGIIDYEVLEKIFPIINWESKFYHYDRHGAEGIYYRIFRSDGSSRWIKTFSEIVIRFDRLDLVELYNLVMQRLETITPEGVDLVLWGNLRTMFNANAEDELWQNQEKWNLKSWNFYDNCGLIAESASDSAYDLLRFIQKQIDEAGSHDGGEKDI
ncbi:hypothetical protein Tco_0909504 [Tanacetum coccineum]|uniref:Xylulose kinase-1 n=1 Tax=Tanacetum coccineum TaxID=301880 RepID=A0ABQ5CXE4_9ASTR